MQLAIGLLIFSWIMLLAVVGFTFRDARNRRALTQKIKTLEEELAAEKDRAFNQSIDMAEKSVALLELKESLEQERERSEQLLRNLFFKNSPLHDGAVIVRGGRVAAAGCVMPLSDNPHLPSDLGTRHRAGVGTSEVSDAVVVIVSEENGTISVAIGGMLKRHLAPQTLQRLLSNELLADEAEKKTLLKRLAGCFSRKDGSK